MRPRMVAAGLAGPAEGGSARWTCRLCAAASRHLRRGSGASSGSSARPFQDGGGVPSAAGRPTSTAEQQPPPGQGASSTAVAAEGSVQGKGPPVTVQERSLQEQLPDLPAAAGQQQTRQIRVCADSVCSTQVTTRMLPVSLKTFSIHRLADHVAAD